MLYNDLTKKISVAMERWMSILSEADGEFIKFLKGCYLVLNSGSLQMNINDFKNDIIREIVKQPLYLKKTTSNCRYISLSSSILDLEAKSQNNKDLLSKLNEVQAELHEFDLSSLDFIDSLNVEVRFPAINFDFIYRLKNHPLVNPEKTCLCNACIKIVL